MAITPDYVAELSRRTDITELVRGYVELKRAGRLERGLCPFHNEKTPSFYVYPETESFYCFGCGTGGDAITFVRNIQNLSYPEAVRFLAERAGMALPDQDDEQAKRMRRLLAINRESAHFYVDALNAPQGAEARAYLRRRGFTDATIRRFGLGFAPDAFGDLLSHLKRKGYDDDELLLAGVCKKGRGGGLYDAFRNRVIFPIIDLRGSVIAFGGRNLSQEYGPKYLNSADTPVFKKSRTLFALNMAKKETSKRYLLAEGYMDVISLHQAGFTTAVATLGTALTAEQTKMVSNYADELVLCYDSDEAGRRATDRAIQLLKHTPLKVRVLDMEDAKDPDEYIEKYGAARFKRLLDGSGNTIEYNLAQTKDKFDIAQPDGRSSYIHAALQVLAQQATPVEQDIYAGRIAEETDVAKSAILTQLEGVNRRHQRQLVRRRKQRLKEESTAASINIPPNVGGEKALGVVFAEQQLMAALLKNPDDFLPLVAKRLKPEQFISDDMRAAYELILARSNQIEHLELASLSDELPDKTVSLLGRVIAINYETGFSEEDLEMFISRIEAGGDSDEQALEMSGEEMQQHFDHLRKKKQ